MFAATSEAENWFTQTMKILSSPIALVSYVIIFAIILILLTILIIAFESRWKHQSEENPPVVTMAIPSQQENPSPVHCRFPELSAIDAHPAPKPAPYPCAPSLASLCISFRDYAARERLYYSLADIRRFVASLSTSRVLILQGMSGTGKTSLPVVFGRFLSCPASVIPVQPMWKERSDLLGYYNEFTGVFSETPLLERLYASAEGDRFNLIVLDELNIARVEYYFAEFLSLLELPDHDSRCLDIAASGREGDPRLLHSGKLVLPDNVWFIGTANNDDSTFAISDKVYDRAMIINLNHRATPFRPEHRVDGCELSAPHFEELVEKARLSYRLSLRKKQQIDALDSYLSTTFQVTFGNRIMRQIELYVPAILACGGSEDDAIDDILSTKVLRKLESRNPVYVKRMSQALLSQIAEIFGEGALPECEAYVNTLAENA